MTADVLTVSKAAQRVGISRRKLLRRVHDSTIKAERMGGVWITDDHSLDEYAKDQKHRRVPA